MKVGFPRDCFTIYMLIGRNFQGLHMFSWYLKTLEILLLNVRTIMQK